MYKILTSALLLTGYKQYLKIQKGEWKIRPRNRDIDIDVLSVNDSEDESSSVDDCNSDIFTVTTEISDGDCHDDTGDDFIDTGDENDDVDTE